MNRISQIIKNMEFFCKLANLKEFGYNVEAYCYLEKTNSVIFPCIGYYDTFFIKLRYLKKIRGK